MATALVFTGGDPPPFGLAAHLPPSLPGTAPDLPSSDLLVIAADSGLEHAHALGYRVEVVIGDLDSVDPRALDAAVAAGATVEAHPREKDATDLELALDAVIARRIERGITRLTVVGGGGGRLDHHLANLLVMASERCAALTLDAWLAPAHVMVVRDQVELQARVGALCSLLPVHGPAIGVTTSGLRYALDESTLAPGSTRGVSNELLDSTARVTLRSGTLLVILPDGLSDSAPNPHI